MNSAVIDNLNGESVGEYLNKNIDKGTKLSIVLAYFTIYAFNALKDKLYDVEKVNFCLTTHYI